MKNLYWREYRYVFVLACILTVCSTSMAIGLQSGLSSSQTLALNGSGQQELLNLYIEDGVTKVKETDYTWTESQVASDGLYPSSSQGNVDVITGQDGNLYCAFYDDRIISGYPNHKSVYVRKSTDGGATWENIDGGATGFALSHLGGLGDARPSVEVWETTPGNFRIAVAVSAGDETLSSYDIVVLWKELGLANDWTTYFLGSNSFDYALPRIKAVPRPSNPSRNRLVVSYVILSGYGYYLSTYSDTDAASFPTSATFISDIDAYDVWRSDLMYDEANDRLFIVWSMSEYNDPSHLPKVLICCSPDRAASWYMDIFQISPPGWNVCAEAEAALSSNPLQTDPQMMVVYSAQQGTSDIFEVHYTHQLLNVITEGGGTWEMTPAGHPVFRGTVYSDTNGDNTMPAIWADNRLTNGGFRVGLLDETSLTTSRMLYTESTFDSPGVWMTPDEVSAPGADPARQGGVTGVSSGIAVGTGLYSDTRVVVWPDYRNGVDSEVYCARYPSSGAVPTVTPTATVTPTTTPTPAATGTPKPIPTTGQSGIGLLILVISLLMLGVTRRR